MVRLLLAYGVLALATPASAQQFAPNAGDAHVREAPPASVAPATPPSAIDLVAAAETYRVEIQAAGEDPKQRSNALAKLRDAISRATEAPAEQTASPFSLSASARQDQRAVLRHAITQAERAYAQLARDVEAARRGTDPHHLADKQRAFSLLGEELRILRERLVDNGRASEAVRRFPVLRTDEEAASYFGGGEAVGSAALVFPGSGGALFVQFYSDNANLGSVFGYARMGFGAFVQSGTDDEGDAEGTSELTADAFLNNGGNAAFYLAMPLIDGRFLPRPGASASHDLQLSLFALPRLAAQFPELTGETSASSWNGEMALEGRVSFTTVRDVFRVFAAGHAAAVAGSPDFYTALDAPSAFSYFRYDFGVDIVGRLRVSAQRAAWGPSELTRGPLVLNIQLLQGIAGK